MSAANLGIFPHLAGMFLPFLDQTWNESYNNPFYGRGTKFSKLEIGARTGA